MMTDSFIPSRNRRAESLCYAALWLLAVTLFLLTNIRERSYNSEPISLWELSLHCFRVFVPFFFLFVVNNFLLIPRLLLPGRIRGYFLATVILVLAIWAVQFLEFRHLMETLGPPPRAHRHRPPLIALPVFLDVIFDLLVVGINLSTALLFRHYSDRLEHESLLKQSAEHRLTYLKAQINPHFYLNMLNNIHGMIEIDTTRAQEMVLGMSRLMRYMLYDSSRPSIPLSSEVGFISDYLAVMRMRYPESKVRISASFPSSEEMQGITVPPLIFLVFIENAFKHGISYRHDSFVAVNLQVAATGAIEFTCLNSIADTTAAHTTGIGLANVRERLRLIYGGTERLDITAGDGGFGILLVIPPN